MKKKQKKTATPTKQRSHDHYEIRVYVEMLKCESIWHTSIYLWERDTPQFVIILIWGITFSLYTAHDVSFRFEFDHFKWSRTNETHRHSIKPSKRLLLFACKQSNIFLCICANLQQNKKKKQKNNVNY